MSDVEAEGGCLCGHVRYRVKGEVILSGNCHCESCRRQTSSPITSFFRVRRREVTFNDAVLSRYASSPGVERTFCGKCGSPISFETERRPDRLDLFTLTLDFPDKMSPKAHYHWDESVSWLDVGDDLEKVAGST